MEQRVMTKAGMQKVAAVRAKLAFMVADLSNGMVKDSKELDYFLLKAEELTHFACRAITLNPENFTVTEINLPTNEEKKTS